MAATATSQEKGGGVWWIDTTSIDIWWPLSSIVNTVDVVCMFRLLVGYILSENQV